MNEDDELSSKKTESKAKSYRKLIAKIDDFEYYVIYENGESHMEVNLIQPSGNERSYWERMSCWGF